ncbi:MAG: class I SAM-dependent methyltransferase [Thermodesulfobacteriota bacterium]
MATSSTSIDKKKVTRGHGFLENFLAGLRAKKAESRIPPASRKGRILDVGCGSYPLFLMGTEFSEKFGVDQTVTPDIREELSRSGIALVNHDFEHEGSLPFQEDHFDVVTMLATIEHIEPRSVTSLLGDVRRVMVPGGALILTTPLAWTDGLLRVMAKLRLVSPVELEDHKDIYTPEKMVSLLREGGFEEENIRFEYFELFMNMCVVAAK